MRLIDADELMKTIKNHHYLLTGHINSKDYGMFTVGIQQAIDEQPTVSTPVLHGKWIYIEDMDIQCSVCGSYALTEGDYPQESNYCPHCGAKMDLEDE